MGEIKEFPESETMKVIEDVENNNPVIKDGEEPAPHQEDIEKPLNHKEWRVYDTYKIKLGGEWKDETFDRSYIQKPLSYIGFGEFTGLLGRKLAEAMKGPGGLSLDRISPGQASIPLEWRDGQISLSSEDGNLVDPIVQGIATIASYVPELIAEAQCIWLSIPRHERAHVVEIWSKSPIDGGMSVDEGEQMFNIFIEQNYDELNGFLKRYARVKDTFQKMRKRNQKDD